MNDSKNKEKPDAPPSPPPLSYSKKTLVAILNTPFNIAGAVTGYHQPIPKELESVLAETSEQILKDFGAEMHMKWLNLSVFGVVYAGVGFSYYTGLGEHLKKRKAKDAEVIRIRTIKRKEAAEDGIDEHMRDRDQG